MKFALFLFAAVALCTANAELFIEEDPTGLGHEILERNKRHIGSSEESLEASDSGSSSFESSSSSSESSEEIAKYLANPHGRSFAKKGRTVGKKQQKGRSAKPLKGRSAGKKQQKGRSVKPLKGRSNGAKPQGRYLVETGYPATVYGQPMVYGNPYGYNNGGGLLGAILG